MQRKLTFILAGLGASIIVLLVLAVVGLGVETGLDGRSFRNISSAMNPTVLPGEYFTVRALTHDDVGVLERGSLVWHVFPPDPSKQFVKRIVGVPGDTLWMERGQLFRNSRPVNEPYAWHGDAGADPSWDEFQWQEKYLLPLVTSSSYKASRDNWGPLLVPANDYFVLGDNRDNSLDSRYWGFVPFEDVRGMPTRIYWSQDPETHTVRWDRIGHRFE